MSGRHSWVRAWMTAAVLLFPLASHAADSNASNDTFSALLPAWVALPVLVLAGSGVSLIGRPRDRTRTLLRALAGSLVGLLATAVLGAAISANSARDVGFAATTVLTLGFIPAGLMGLIVGGLVSLLQPKPPRV